MLRRTAAKVTRNPVIMRMAFMFSSDRCSFGKRAFRATPLLAAKPNNARNPKPYRSSIMQGPRKSVFRRADFPFVLIVVRWIAPLGFECEPVHPPEETAMTAMTPNYDFGALPALASRLVAVETLPWTPTPFAGIEVKTLLKDEATGLLTCLFQWAPGA